MTDLNLQSLIGKTVVEVCGKKGDDTFVIKTDCGFIFEFYHRQDCCEHVYLEDIIGDTDDLIDSQIMMAEEVSNNEEIPSSSIEGYHDSHTWTFYRLASMKGLVVLRFYGSSNGYYSESMSVRVTNARLN